MDLGLNMSCFSLKKLSAKLEALPLRQNSQDRTIKIVNPLMPSGNKKVTDT